MDSREFLDNELLDVPRFKIEYPKMYEDIISIMDRYHREQVEKLNIDNVSNQRNLKG